MKTVFQSRGTTCDVEILGGEAAFLIRFSIMMDSGDENYAEPLHDLVIAPSSYGFLTLKKVGGDGVLSGFLDEQHFNRDIVDDIVTFIENTLPGCRDIYLPYHIDFVALTHYEEYNGEY